jgi:hypothetical protein
MDVTYSTVFLGTAILEGLIAWYVLVSNDYQRKEIILLWISGIFCGYHITLFVLNPAAPCPCLGAFNEWLHLSNGAARSLVVVGNVYMGLFAAIFTFADLNVREKISRMIGTFRGAYSRT